MFPARRAFGVLAAASVVTTLMVAPPLDLPMAAAVAPAASAPASVAAADTVARLSNGCSSSSRGIPSCGAYAGGAYNSNTDPASWESWLSKQIGVRRTYYGPTGIDKAVSTARQDVANHRVPWISFKAPYSWSDMASGRGDAWAREIAKKLATVDGPVWVAVHHEPENDGGDITKWTAMQARLGPILRGGGDNIAFTIILMGWHQFYGAEKFRIENMWPRNTKVDIAGFDVYDEYGMTKNGTMVTQHKDFRGRYFEPMKAWSTKTGVKWGLAETGFSEASVRHDPAIMSKTFKALTDNGGIAFSYFNTNLNASLDWRLNTSLRQRAFKDLHRVSVTRAAGPPMCDGEEMVGVDASLSPELLCRLLGSTRESRSPVAAWIP